MTTWTLNGRVWGYRQSDVPGSPYFLMGSQVFKVWHLLMQDLAAECSTAREVAGALEESQALATETQEAALAVAEDKATVAADKGTVAADKATVAADKGTVAADKATVAADKGTVAADKATVAADKGTVAADKATVAADKATVAADKAIVAGARTDTLNARDQAIAAQLLAESLASSAAESLASVEVIAAELADGRVLHVTIGVPAGVLGRDGDMAIQAGVYPVLFGPKTAGAWGSGIPLRGSVSGPASTTPGKVAVWSDTTGTVLGEATMPALSDTNPLALGTPAPGMAGTVARADHVHPLPALATTGAPGLMSGTDKAKLDGVATGATNTPLSNATPSAPGTATQGIANSAARGDHVHPLPPVATTLADGLLSKDDKAKLNGIASGATNVALASTTPAALGTGSPGSSGAAARADHVHPLPALATTGAAGLMSSADKAKLDSVAAVKTANGAAVAVGECFLMTSPSAMPAGWTYSSGDQSITIPMGGGTWVGRYNVTSVIGTFHGGLIGHPETATSARNLLWYAGANGAAPTVNSNVGAYLPIIFQRLA